MKSQAQTLIQRAFEKKKKDFKGFSLRWMAKQLGVSHVYTSHLVRGVRPLPIRLVEPICRILDLDVESRGKIFYEVFNSKGFQPTPESKRKKSLLTENWILAPVKDFDLLSRWEFLAVLQATRLIDYDGSAEFLTSRLFLPKVLVESILELLKKKGYLVFDNGVYRASETFYEFQSQASKDQIRKYHASVLVKAKEVLETQKKETDLERRLLTSATVTCSKEKVQILKSRIADFLKEFVEESAATDPDSVYQIGIQFFPVTR